MASPRRIFQKRSCLRISTKLTMLKWSSGGDRSCGSGASIEYRLRYGAAFFCFRELETASRAVPCPIQSIPVRSGLHVIKRDMTFTLVEELKGPIGSMVLAINVDSSVVGQL